MNAYDFDKTIYDGDSTADFYFYCLLHQPQILLWLPYQAWSFFLYVVGFYTKTQFKERFYKFFKSVKDIEQTVEKFWDKNISGIKSWYLENSRDDDIIISASPEFLLRPACERLKIKNLIASRVNLHDGKYTGLNCYGEEKVARFFEAMPNAEYECFYSDSLSDEPLALLAKKEKYIVEGDKLIPWNDYKISGIKKLRKMIFSIEFLSFLAVGVVNTFNGVLFAYIYSLIPFFNAIIAFDAGYITALTVSYFLNTYITFKNKPNFIKYVKFAVSYIPNFIIQNIVVVVMYNLLNLHKLISYALAAIIGMPLTFLLMKIFVFKSNQRS